MAKAKLFDYQQEMRSRILEAFKMHDSVMCQMPTGTGKTHVLAAVVSEYAKGKLVWVVAHRKELIEQIERTWDTFYQGKKNAPEVRVMSIQWLSRNWEKVAATKPAMIVIDEAHHALADTYQELFRRYPDAKKLGMTATPYRMSGKGFVDLFDVLLQSRSIPEFVTSGRLSLFDYYAVPHDSKIRRQIALLKKRGADGDYQTKELELSLNTPRNIEYLYNSLMRYAKRPRGIVYAINISHARAIAAFYAEKGLKCCAIDSKTPAKEREAMVEAFRGGEIDVMVNVDIFSEGFDCPEVEFIQLARPTLSLAVYLQQIGRGLRKAKGKKYCVILDNVGLSRTFGTPIRKWDWEKMFKGSAENVRIDVGDRRNLLKFRGYPGKLVDEPMEKLISHDEMNDAIKFQDLLVYSPDDNLVGIKLGGKIVARKPVLKVLSFKSGIIVVQLKNNLVRMFLPTGKELKMPNDFKEFELLKNNIVRVVTEKGEEYFKDLVSDLLFRKYPVFETYGPFEFIGNGSSIWLRSNILIDFDRNHIGNTTWNDYYFKTLDLCPIARTVYLPYARYGNHKTGDLSFTVFFENDEKRYYFVEELSRKRIIVVNLDRQYYLVTPTLSMKYLFTAESYSSSKQKLEHWVEKLAQ